MSLKIKGANIFHLDNIFAACESDFLFFLLSNSKPLRYLEFGSQLWNLPLPYNWIQDTGVCNGFGTTGALSSTFYKTNATTVYRHSGPVLNQCFITDKANLGRREGFPSFLVCFPPKSLVQWSTFYLSPKHLGRCDVPPSDENVFFGTVSRCNIFIWAAARWTMVSNGAGK